MGDDEKTPLKLDFDSKVRVEFRGATITSDAGGHVPSSGVRVRHRVAVV